MTIVDVDALEAARAAATAKSGPGYFNVTTYTAPYREPCMETHTVTAENSCPVDEPCAHFVAAIGATVAGQRAALLAAVRERDALRAAVADIAEDLDREGVFQAFHGPVNRNAGITDRLRALLADVDGGQR